MKKSKLVNFFVVLIGILFIPFFVGCTNLHKIELNQPSQIEFACDENGSQIIYVPQNPFASGYLFGISETESTNLDDFVRYTNPAKNQKGVAQNFLDVTNLFSNNKTYYYYAEYLGDGKYSNSKPTAIKNITITTKLDAPELSVSDTSLSWTKVDNADYYTVYANTGYSKLTALDKITSTHFDFSNYIDNLVRNGLSSKVKFTVCAGSNGNYLKSSESNAIEYFEYLKLQAPQSLSLEGEGKNKTISWSKALHCNSYTLQINLSQTVVVDQTNWTLDGSKIKFDVSNYYVNLGKYSFRVKCNAQNNYIASEYSQPVIDTYSQKLDTPQNVKIIDRNPNVEITWDAVSFANEYEVYFSDIENHYQLKQFKINSNSGVESPIVANSIMLTYSQMGINSILDLNNAMFRVVVYAKGYDYYEKSDSSTGKQIIFSSNVIESPVITDNANSETISWPAVAGATKYKIFVQIGDEVTVGYTTNTSFSYSSQITTAGEYKIYCVAISATGVESNLSNIIQKVSRQKLKAPVIKNIVVEDDQFVIDFKPSENATQYTLFVQDKQIKNDITTEQNTVAILDALNGIDDADVAFSLRANETGYFDQSPKSGVYYLKTQLQTPTIKVLGNTLSWSGISLATGYNLILDDKFTYLSTTDTSLDLSQYVGINTARQVRVQAVNQYLKNSNLSQTIYYNNVAVKRANYTDRYFYFGQTYDYYITSDEELYDAIDYVFVNFQTNLDIYIDYDRNVSIENKYAKAFSNIVGTYSYARSRGSESLGVGSDTLQIKYAEISSAPNYKPSTTQYQYGMVYSGSGTRDNSHIFASDNYIVSQNVWTTDGLVSAIENKAKPNFVGTTSIAKKCYDKAKEILIEICDDDMTDLEKSLAIHDYIVTNVAYDNYGLSNIGGKNLLGIYHYLESPMLYGLAVCDGYAKMYSLLCNMEGIKCIVVAGLANKEDPGSGHAWNKIYLDTDGDGANEWYIVDCTHDDPGAGNNTEYLRHEYFMATDEMLSVRQEFKAYPKTTKSTEGFYGNFKAFKSDNYDGLTLKIDDKNSLDKLKAFLNDNDKYSIEVLVKSSYLGSLGYGYTSLSYDSDPNYKIVYLHK